MKKTTFFKTLLVAACLCLGSMSAWADPIETVGANDFSTGWWSAFSSTYTLEGYGKYHFQFTTTNVNDGNVYKTWLLVATNGNDSHGGGGTEYFVWRGEGYSWGQGGNSNDNPTIHACSNTYSTANPTGAGIQAAMNGASVDMVITRESNNIYATATVTPANGENEFTMSFSYLYGNATSANIGLFLTVENAQVVLNTAEQTAEWSTVWSTDFSSAPSGITYTMTGGGASVGIGDGYLLYKLTSASGARTMTTSFTDASFNVDTDWIMDFDWSCVYNSSNSNVVFATNSGDVFKIEWNGSNATITDYAVSPNTLTSTLPHQGTYSSNNTIIANVTSPSHFAIRGVKDDGIYLTVTKGGVTYVNNVKISSTFSYPKSFNGSLARYYSSMAMDNIIFRTPAVAGFVATPTSEITGASGTSRKFTLSCLTDGVTMYYATSDLEKGAAGWNTYSGEVTTAATTIYAYAEDGKGNTSDKMNFTTGAGTTVNLVDATVTHSNNGVYTIASDQSAILGAPTATIHYQIDGGSELTSTNASVNVNIVADGTLTYWLTAEGYGATDPADETVYAPRAYAATTTLNFCTNSSTSSAVWAYGNATDYDLSTITVATVNTDRTYYKYLDESSNIIGDGLLAVSAVNGGQSWRIDKNNAGVHPYNKTEYVVLLGMEAGQLIQIAASSAPSSTSNLTAVPAATYTGTYTYTATADGEVIFSLDKNVVLKTIKLCETTVSKTITSAGWATYCSPYALDFSSSIANLTKAYSVTGATGSTLDLEEITGKVPANTGILLEGEGEVVIPVAASADAVVGNKLVGKTSEYELPAGDGYVLLNGTNGVGFYINPDAVFTVGANTAYLPADFAGARAFYLFDDETTDIKTVQDSKFMVNDYFDLQGRRVAQPTKGLYIVNGRKIVIK